MLKRFLRKKRGRNPEKFWKFIAVIILFLVSLTIALPGLPYFKVGSLAIGKKISEMKIRLGLDLQGGTYLVYRAELDQLKPSERTESLDGVRDVIERRVNAFGVAEPIIQTSQAGNEYRLVVELAGVNDVGKAIAMIGETPTLDFREQKTPDDVKYTDEQKKEIVAQNDAQLKLANQVLEEAKKPGSDFAALAQKYSEDPGSKDKGGDLDFFKKGMMVPEFDAVAFNPDFKKDTVWPELVKTQYGYHILKKTDERGDGDNKEVKISHILFTTKNADYNENALAQDPFKQTGLTGKQLERADVIFDPNTGEPQVSLTFNGEGADLFRQITERNVEKRVPIFLDGEPITMPVIRSVIADGKAVISGNFSIEEAKNLQKRLNEGALPVPITLIQQQNIGASLGQESLDKSLLAGAIGFIIVAFFMIIIYRWPGIVAAIALFTYTLILVSIFKLSGITLSLSGIAGLILSIGIAVDANVLIFERIREELRRGRNKSLAISEGFKRAWPSIRDGNASTIITCVVLISFGTGMVKGFAISLLVGVLLSMFTAIVVTRAILDFFLKNEKKATWWWGVKDNER